MRRYQLGTLNQNHIPPSSHTGLPYYCVSILCNSLFLRYQYSCIPAFLPLILIKYSTMQNYSNHTRYYPFHHFFITPLSLVVLVWSVFRLFNALNDEGDVSLAILLTLMALLFVTTPLLARIYALKNQNRIIRMEMRLRYFQLSGQPFEPLESKLRMGQIVALRFAGDDELLPLIEKAIQEKLPPKEIKLSIKNWKEDRHRV